MARRKRLILPNVPVHVIQRGNNRQVCFFGNGDYRKYLEWLGQYAQLEGCKLHAYVLMTNHVHLLVSPGTADGLGRFMKRLGQRYVQHINWVYQRTGTLWEGRYRSCLAQEEAYVLACYRYIEMNPVRAGMVAHPGEYPWSSYRANALGEPDPLLTSDPVYDGLGADAGAREAAYRQLFDDQLSPGLIKQIRRATNGNYALGSKRFAAQVEQALDRRASPGLAGRPANR